MANNPQAKKRIRQTARRSAVNTARVSRIRTFVRKVEEAIESGNKAAAESALAAVQPELMRGAAKGVMHKSTASRKVSRLTRRVKAMA
ncbi:MAG: 30S ribosomal protein S20 [Proteobacteria bacterium]|jgi:small subunit ribosomal protein S20|nr:MAG: 30S ribosomal protein S20 [Pseudomonadota bacterium]